MCDFLHRLETDHARRTFEAVGFAEDFLKRLGAPRRPLQTQEPLVELLEMLLGLRLVDGEDLPVFVGLKTHESGPLVADGSLRICASSAAMP